MSLIDRLRDAWNQAKEEPETEQQKRAGVEPQRNSDSRYDQFHIQTIVGIPEAPSFQFKEAKGDIRTYEHDENGSRLHLDSKGQFYTQERQQIEREAASNLQRLSTEWQLRSYDNTNIIQEDLGKFTAPAIAQYVQENRLAHVGNASPEQREELISKIKTRTGITEENATLAVLTQVRTQHPEQWEQMNQKQQNDEHNYSNYRDVLRGKAGPNAMQESREYNFAETHAQTAMEAFATKNNVSIEQMSAEQVQQVGKELSRHHQIPIAIATDHTSWVHQEEVQKADRRNGILEVAVGAENAKHYTWKQESGDIESYQHNTTGRYVHLDSDSLYYDQTRKPADATTALSHAEEKHTVAPPNEMAAGKPDNTRDLHSVEYQTPGTGKIDHVLPNDLTVAAHYQTDPPRSASAISVEQINAITSRALTEAPLDEQMRIARGIPSVDEINAITNRALSEKISGNQIEQSLSL